MTYSTNYCHECGAPSPSYPCDVCEEIQAHMIVTEPTDEELGAMAAYYDEFEANLEEQARMDAYDDMDHDLPI
jgi:hypothetical protein